MKIDKLEVGVKYKSYKALCEMLEINIKTGNAKIAQLKDMDRYFEHDKIGNSFIITKIYDTPLPKQDNNKNLAPYIKQMEVLLLHYLQQCQDNKLSISTIALAQDLKMIHRDYRTYYDRKYELSNMLDVNIIQVTDFMTTTNNAYKQAIKTILSRLEQRMIIMNEYRYKVERMQKILNDDSTVTTNTYHDYATDKEKDEILKIKYDTLQYYGGDIQALYNDGRIHEYYEEVNNIMFMDIGISKAYKVHEITINHNAVNNEYYKSMIKILDSNENEIQQLQMHINKLWSDRNLKRMSNKVHRIDKSKHSYSKLDNQRLDITYDGNMLKLNDALVISGVDKVIKEVKELNDLL